MPYWLFDDHELLDLLKRAREGADPQLLLLEVYANSEVEDHGDETE